MLQYVSSMATSEVSTVSAAMVKRERARLLMRRAVGVFGLKADDCEEQLYRPRVESM